ncbi:hypothetical protein [Hymenobacter properus]|uniref:Septum formation inhibitor Maf n=1 Tax=Hymenobacter properus TaxID=2791026 RepID=A0A931FKV9_9BACT|nr:hypothetical protein [Hymenobacter properus]MBF9140114.1 hypothetical protein [Hymenobacter properus]MBR7718921.1 hypothetical protein [Microvirga sp. SRT04]
MPRSPLRTALLPLLLSASLLGCNTPEKEQAKGRAPASAQALQAVLPYFDQGWAMNKLWEDGQAEVATYAAERMIYKKKRAFEYTMITVKEEFNQQYNVKTDDYQRDDLFPVMKINQFCSIQADEYPYHYLTSLFFRRDQPVALYKMTTSSQEWCGNTFKSIIDDGVNFEMWYHSYWDGEGSNSRDLRRDVFLEDALPYTLRSLKFDQKPAFDLTVLDLQQTNRAKPPVYYQAHLTTAEAPADALNPAAWRVTLQLAPDKQSTYVFAKEYPNMLLRQATWDGRTLQLKAHRRYAYWPK